MTASIVLGLLSAVLFALAGALQHAVTRPMAAATAAGSGAAWLPVLPLVLRLLRHPLWLCGLLANVLDFVVHSAALHMGSITIVQALLAVQLMLALPLAASRTGRPPLLRDWFGTIAICAGLALLIMVRGDVPQTAERRELVPYVALAGVLLMAALVASARLVRLRHGPARTALVGIAAGTGFSITAVFIVVVTDQLARQGFWAAVLDWPMLGLAASGLVAAIVAQDAFASGSLPTALTAMTVADPIVSWFWGAVLFDATPPTDPLALVAMTSSAALIAIGVAVLAFSPTRFASAAWAGAEG